MEILIIEDERPSADRLVKLLKECCADANVTSVLQSVQEGKEYFCSGRKADLIISDISLPDGLCFSIFEDLSIDCPIIFTTAYDEYALKAFDFNSIAYLLKPIRKEDLVKSLAKMPSHPQTSDSDLSELLKKLSEGKVRWRERILIENGEELRPIKVKNVSFFKYDMGATKAVMKNKSGSYCELSLDRLEEQLDPERFLRVSRQFIINIEEVISIKRIDTKHSLIRMKESDEEIVATNIRCNRLKVMLDR